MLLRSDSEKYALSRRAHLGRSALGELAKRDFDPIEVFKRSCTGRVPTLLPIKFRLMSSSPFAFFLGSAGIMAADFAAAKNTQIEAHLSDAPHLKPFAFSPSPTSAILHPTHSFY